MDNSQNNIKELQGEFGEKQWSNLKRLFRVLIKTVEDIGNANAEAAGIPEYIANKLARARKADANAYKKVLKEYKELVEALEWIAQRLNNASFDVLDELRAEVVVRCALTPSEIHVRPGGDLDKQFKRVRNDCFEGYFAHPRHRDMKGIGNWDAIGFSALLRRDEQLPFRDAFQGADLT